MNIKEAVKTYSPSDHKEGLINLKSEIDKLTLKNISSENIFAEHFFLNCLGDYVNQDFLYLECGTFWGRSLICTSWQKKEKDFFGCDNFVMHTNGPSFKTVGTKYHQTKEVCMINVNASNKANENGGMAHLIIGDWFDLLSDFDRYMNGKKIGIYFYDAGHSFEETLIGLQRGAPNMRDDGIIIVDDTGHMDEDKKRDDAPRKAVNHFVKESDFILLRDFDDMTSDPKDGFSTGMMILSKG